MMDSPFLNQLLTLPTVLSASLSPDRRWVAFVWYRVHANLDVFLVPADGTTPPVALTHTPEATGLVSWSPDSRSVVVVEDHDGDERDRLFRVFIDHPGAMHPLTEDRPSYFLRGGNLSPDGHWLVYGANYDFSAGKEIEQTWIYRHDLQSGERIPIAKPEKPTYLVVSLNQPGDHVLYCRKDRHPAGRQFWLADVYGRQDEEILNFGDEVKVYARWFPDGERILVLSESTGQGPQEYISLGVYNRVNREMRWLLDDPKRMIESAWVSPDGLIVVDEISQARHTPSFIDPEPAGLPWVEEHFPKFPGNLQPIGRGEDGAWIAMYSSSTNPAELIRFNDQKSLFPEVLAPSDRMRIPWVSLTKTWQRTTLQPHQLTPAERFTWKSVDSLEIQGWLYRAKPNPHQAVIYVHGGPTSHSEDRLNPQIQYFVSQGFNVLDVNYRGSTGFGLTFREAIKEDGWGGREQADILTGAEAVIRAGLAGAGRVAITGTSYGGYSAWFQITHAAPDLIGAAAPICGMTDLGVDYETTRPDLRPLSEEMMGGRPDQVPQHYFERSPINFVQQIQGKLLIVQGALDPNVTPENVREVVTRLEQHHIPYELLVFEDEGHGIVKPVNQERLYTKLAQFFKQALSPENL